MPDNCAFLSAVNPAYNSLSAVSAKHRNTPATLHA